MTELISKLSELLVNADWLQVCKYAIAFLLGAGAMLACVKIEYANNETEGTEMLNPNVDPHELPIGNLETKRSYLEDIISELESLSRTLDDYEQVDKEGLSFNSGDLYDYIVEARDVQDHISEQIDRIESGHYANNADFM